MAGCSATDLQCMLAAGRSGVNIYDANSGVGSLPGTIPGVGGSAPDFIGDALKGVGLGGVDSWLSKHVDSPIAGAFSDTYNAVAGPANAVGSAISFITDPPRVAVTLIGFLLIAGGIFMLGRNQIMQVVKP